MKILPRSLISFVFFCIITNVFAEKTLWDQMPKSMDGKFNYFQKIDRQGVFKYYSEMRGTRFIFACVNAQVYYLFAFQRDSIKDEGEAQNVASNKCEESIELSLDKSGTPIKLPLGTPIMLRFQKDYGAYDGYMNSLDKWTQVAQNDQTQIFLHKGRRITTSAGYRGSWVLSNFNRSVEYGSIVSMREFDCNQRRFRITKIIAYADKYGQGKKLQDLDDPNRVWTLAPPDSLFEALVDAACQ